MKRRQFLACATAGWSLAGTNWGHLVAVAAPQMPATLRVAGLLPAPGIYELRVLGAARAPARVRPTWFGVDAAGRPCALWHFASTQAREECWRDGAPATEELSLWRKA
jgi:hypothetical protein